jgi:hypothetical protein
MKLEKRRRRRGKGLQSSLPGKVRKDAGVEDVSASSDAEPPPHKAVDSSISSGTEPPALDNAGGYLPAKIRHLFQYKLFETQLISSQHSITDDNLPIGDRSATDSVMDTGGCRSSPSAMDTGDSLAGIYADRGKVHLIGPRKLNLNLTMLCTLGISLRVKVGFYLTSVVVTNSDPSDEIHLWIIISLFLLPLQVTPGTFSSTLRQVSRVKSSTLEGSNSRPFRLTKHTPALGSSGGRHRIPEGSRGRLDLHEG